MNAGNGRPSRGRVIVGSDSLVLIAGLAAALRSEGFTVARGMSQLDRVRERLVRERIQGLILATASPIVDDLVAVLHGRPRHVAALVLLPDISLRVHADAIQSCDAICLPLTVHPKEIAGALARAGELAQGVTVVRESVVRGAGGRLSPREAQALERIAQGETNDQAAAALGVSPETIKTHLRHAFRKLGVRNRTEAVTAYLEAGSARPSNGRIP